LISWLLVAARWLQVLVLVLVLVLDGWE